MFCRYCGKEIADDAKFCRFCGKQMPARQAAQAAPAPEAKGPAPEAKAAAQPSVKGPITAIVAAAAVAVLWIATPVFDGVKAKFASPPPDLASGSSAGGWGDSWGGGGVTGGSGASGGGAQDPGTAVAPEPVPTTAPTPTSTPTPTQETAPEPAPAATYAAPYFPDLAASSVRAPMGSVRYYVEYVQDGKLSTAWDEGGPGPGIGEWIEFHSYEPQHVTGFRIFNGYGKSQTLYYKNNAIRDLIVVYDSGQATFTLNLMNAFQEVVFDQPIDTTSIRFQIGSVYPATENGLPDVDEEDTLISEIEFF
ncbi:MAG: zinc-ribbon domain-containing protein [Clostridiales Family XIII bacterium]|jgi:hypothetical protein|nr:zinc-ribbon domain-containing protein [Clostridiales Family XIII bacterium]